MQNPICHLAPDWMNRKAGFQTNRVGCQKFRQIRTNPAQGQFEKNTEYKAICILLKNTGYRIQSNMQHAISDSTSFPGTHCVSGNWCVTCMFCNWFTSAFLCTTPSDSSSHLLRHFQTQSQSHFQTFSHKCTHTSRSYHCTGHILKHIAK